LKKSVISSAQKVMMIALYLELETKLIKM